jgi:UDP-glucose 4-epimerase
MAFTRLAYAAILGDAFPLLGDGNQSRDFTYIDDAIEATIGCMEAGRSGLIYNIGGGGEITLNEVIVLIESFIGNPIDVVRRAPASGDVRRTASDCTRIREDVGWVAQHSLEEGVANQLEWMRTYHAAAA